MNTNNLKAIWAILIPVILWGISFVSIKITVAYIGPITLIFYRFIISTAILFVISLFSKASLAINYKDIPKFIVSGFIGIVIYFYCQNDAMNHITASEASVIVASIPIFSLMAESIITKTKMSKFKFFLVLLSFIGVYIMIGVKPGGQITGESLLGYTLMFIAVISWVFYGMLSYPLSIKYSQITVVFYQGLFSSIILFALSFLESHQGFDLPNIVIINLVYLGVFCSSLAYYLYNYAVRHLGVSSANLYLNLVPIIAVLTSVFFLKEKIHFNQLVGGSIVLFSVFAVSLIDQKNNNKNTETALETIVS